MKLWLDDERPAPAGWERVTQAWHAISVLTEGNVAEVSLDHDLGPSECGTGYDVLSWLEERAATDPTFVVPIIHVHTANPVARQRMLQTVASIERFVQCR